MAGSTHRSHRTGLQNKSSAVCSFRRPEPWKEADLQGHHALSSRNTAHHIPALSVPGSSPSLHAQHPSTYLLAPPAHLLALPRSHPSIGCSSKTWCSWHKDAPQDSAAQLTTSRHPGQNEEPATCPVHLLFAPSPSQNQAAASSLSTQAGHLPLG